MARPNTPGSCAPSNLSSSSAPRWFNKTKLVYDTTQLNAIHTTHVIHATQHFSCTSCQSIFRASQALQPNSMTLKSVGEIDLSRSYPRPQTSLLSRCPRCSQPVFAQERVFVGQVKLCSYFSFCLRCNFVFTFNFVGQVTLFLLFISLEM